MFLSLKEIFYYKARYALIGSILFLIAFVVFILSGLATGLANDFKQGVVDWQAQKVILSDSSNNLLNASQIDTSDVKKIKGGETSTFSLYSSSVYQTKQDRINVTLFALPAQSAIQPKLLKGQMYRSTGAATAVISEGLAKAGFKIGQTMTIGNHKAQVKIVGISKASEYSASPLIYTSFASLNKVQNDVNSQEVPFVNAVVVRSGKPDLTAVKSGNLKLISIDQLIQNIPGYTAQQITLDAMIYFMFLIVLMIVAVFMYVITLQKLPIFGVMKAQGISNFVIVKALLWQGFWVGGAGVALAFLFSYVSSFAFPAKMPFGVDLKNWILYGLILILVSIFGSAFSGLTIRKIDPTKAIGA